MYVRTKSLAHGLPLKMISSHLLHTRTPQSQTELKRRKRFVQESRETLRRVKSALSSKKTMGKLDQDRRAVRVHSRAQEGIMCFVLKDYVGVLPCYLFKLMNA